MAGSAHEELPTGTVTFMFSDIEGSTRLVQHLGERFAEVLAHHQALMRAALAEHGGREVSTEGDSFFAVFTSPRDAVAAVTAAQRAHAAHSFPDRTAVRVRIGLHTGAGTRGGDNYVGLDVHRGARIASAAHGGEVLLSEITRALVADGLPEGLSTRDLGLHKLKDLQSPERLHRLVIDGLPDDFPPPRSLGSAAHLPQAATSFVGREQEIETLTGLLHQTRLLTLTGPGGTGKTRLALETARRAAAGHRDGAVFVPLDAIRDTELVASAAVEAIGVTEKAASAEEALTAYLANREMLLVFDNFEQVMPAAAMVDRLLASAPGLCAIVTSRIPLQLYGEQEYRVAPLPTPDLESLPAPEAMRGIASVELFLERARAVDPGFSLTAANAATVAEICVRLDGLPLAIELAAARVKLLPPSAILARLGHRLELLAVQSPNLPQRQRTLRAAIDWSWELLNEGERMLFERLAVFRGGWDLESAAAVCLPEELGIDLLDGLASLLNKSLIVRMDADEPRFNLLQTIGEYAYERLIAADGAEDATRRHAHYFCHLAESLEPDLTGPDAAASTARLALEQDNLRAVMAWAVEVDEPEIGLRLASSIWRFWQRRGQLREGREWMDRLLALAGAASVPAVQAKALTAVGGIAYWQGDQAMHRYYGDALALYRSLDDARGIADSLQNLGFATMLSRGSTPDGMDEASRLFEESLDRYRELDDKANIASVVGALGYSRMMTGRLDEARAAITQALELNTARGNVGRANDNRLALAHIDRLAGNLREAAEQYRMALAESREIGDAARTLMQLIPAASLLAVTAHHEAAMELLGAAARARDEQGGMISFAVPGIGDPLAEVRAGGIADAQVESWQAAGRSMDLDAAVDYALATLSEVSSDQAPARGPAAHPSEN
jgi:predicted ATPase/class 3 adenylate cyclase